MARSPEYDVKTELWSKVYVNFVKTALTEEFVSGKVYEN
jgi:hypothetical protein